MATIPPLRTGKRRRFSGRDDREKERAGIEAEREVQERTASLPSAGQAEGGPYKSKTAAMTREEYGISKFANAAERDIGIDIWQVEGHPEQGRKIMSEEFMRRAIALALENVRSGQGGPFAALVVKDGRVIAEGANRVTTTNDPTAHAEVVAIREACRALGDFQLSGCELYTTCEPCPMCLGAIYWARPARIFYASLAADAAAAGFDDAFIYDELKHPLSARRMPMEQLLREESLAIFSLWKSQEKKTPY